MSEINNSQQSIEDGIPEVSFTLEVSNVQQAPVDDSLTISGMAADAKATGDAIAEAKADVEGQLATAKSLGLRKIGDSIVCKDDAVLAGKVKVIAHLVKVENV